MESKGTGSTPETGGVGEHRDPRREAIARLDAAITQLHWGVTADPGKFLNEARARITEARTLIERDWPEDYYSMSQLQARFRDALEARAFLKRGKNCDPRREAIARLDAARTELMHASMIAAPNVNNVHSAQKYIAELRALIERDWPEDYYSMSQLQPRFRDSLNRKRDLDMKEPGSMAELWLNFAKKNHLFEHGPLGPLSDERPFRRRGKNRYACPVCSALVHIDDIHRHAGWHGAVRIETSDDSP